HAHTHAYTHTRMHIYSHTRTHAHKLTRTHTHAYKHTHTHTVSHTHTHTHIHSAFGHREHKQAADHHLLCLMRMMEAARGGRELERVKERKGGTDGGRVLTGEQWEPLTQRAGQEVEA